MSNKLLKKACVFAAASMLPLSSMAGEEGVDWSISGWANEGVTFYDDGVSSDAVQVSDNGTTLGTRVTLTGSADLPGTNGWTGGFEIILEPSSAGELLGWGSSSGLNDNSNGHAIGVLGNSVNVAGAWGKVTVGLQSMPTDNIAVLEDPSLTLWASISPIFRGNAVTITGLGTGATNSTWGSFLQCYTVPGLGIGIDCNGIYRQGVRYDLPAFGPVTVAVGYANDDVYDIAAKYKGTLGRINTQLALGYAINQGGGGSNVLGSESENFQAQLGLMDPQTGLFGSIAYNNDEADGPGIAATASDDMDAWWFKGGIKKTWFAPGDTSLAFQYGSYNDGYGTGAIAASGPGVNFNGTSVASLNGGGVTNPGITGSEVERIGVEVNQYFGSKLILYGVWENLDLDVDCSNATCNAIYTGADDLDTFTLGLTYFF